MQSIRPSSTLHESTCEVIDDDHLAVLYDVLVIFLIKSVRLQSLLHAVEQFHVSWIIQIRDTEKFLSLLDTLFGENCGVVLLVDEIISGRDFGLFVFVTFFEIRNYRISDVVLVGRFI
jgi:hypothetical protein